jgi:hypothetical protein
MKKNTWLTVGMAALAVMAFAACATPAAAWAGGGKEAPSPQADTPALIEAPQTVPPDSGPVFEGDGVSLGEAIERSAEKIAADLPAGSRVAIVA